MREHALRLIASTQKIVTRNEQSGWPPLSNIVLFALKQNNAIIAQYGNDEDKKLYCRILHNCRVKINIATQQHQDYLQLENQFRNLCSPLLDNDNCFLPDEFEESSSTLNISTPRFSIVAPAA